LISSLNPSQKHPSAESPLRINYFFISRPEAPFGRRSPENKRSREKSARGKMEKRGERHKREVRE
jgi:hypothetical protein